MPIITLHTNLKSLKYGNDLPGYGSSGQPFIQYPLPKSEDTFINWNDKYNFAAISSTQAPEEFLTLYKNNRESLDFPIRGGGFNLGAAGPYITQAGKFDQRRIARFLKYAPQGPMFILKQQALQLSNPKMQVGSQVNLDLGAKPFRFNGVLENTRVYNGGANTLLQVGVQGSGFHFDRHGLVPINPYQHTYAYVANERLGGEAGSTHINRLRALYETKIQSQDRIPLDTREINTQDLNTLGISRNPDLLFQYPGGPSSIGGLGLTTIRRVDNTFINVTRTNQSYKPRKYSEFNFFQGPDLESLLLTLTGSNLEVYSYEVDKSVAYAYQNTDSVHILKKENTALSIDPTKIQQSNFGYAFTYEMLQSGSERTQGLQTIKEDFRRKIVKQKSTFPNASSKLASEDYTTNNLSAKYGIGDPGDFNRKRVNYWDTSEVGEDKVNMLDVNEDYPNGVKDLITFKFESLEVDKAGKQAGDVWTVPIIFRAFLTSIQDSYTAEYSPFKYIGRGENFYTYNGASRQMSFTFKIAAQSRQEMEPLYRKLNYLVSQLYPNYKADTGFMRPPIIRLTIGDYVVVQPGFLNSMNITIPDESPWEIALDKPGKDNDMYQLPQVLEVNSQFTFIHDFLPRRSWIDSNNQAHITPFITPNSNPTNGNTFGIGKL